MATTRAKLTAAVPAELELAPSPAAGLLQLARRKAGLSQSQLAARAEVPPTMISAYERGRRDPTLGTLLRIVAAAGFELRLHLEPADPHDDVLGGLERARSPRARARREKMLEAWRNAELVGPSN
jgi:transcriptional regulator with XRE-family HTH domain